MWLGIRQFRGVHLRYRNEEVCCRGNLVDAEFCRLKKARSVRESVLVLVVLRNVSITGFLRRSPRSGKCPVCLA